VSIYFDGAYPVPFNISNAAGPGFSATPSIAAGFEWSYALRNDGLLPMWGSNSDGQLATIFATIFATAPQLVNPGNLSNVSAIAAGGWHGLALMADATVKSWGRNNEGQLGRTVSSSLQNVPSSISGLTSVTHIAAGRMHSLVRKSDATVWVWGNNASGQLGTGNTTPQPLPVQIPTFTNVSWIAAGANHSFAKKGDGTVWAWGTDVYGELGDGGSVSPRLSPVQVAALANVTAISGGFDHTLALKPDNTVLAFGFNGSGQLGDGSNNNHATPTPVPGLSGMTAVAAGYHYSLALKNDGTVWAWGQNDHGQLGIGTLTNRTTPTQVPGLTGIVAIAAGLHSIALRGDGVVFAWGNNSQGQVGNGTRVDVLLPSPVLPVQVEDDFLRLSGLDTRPFPFAFTPFLGAAPNTTAVSNAITVSGLGTGVLSTVQIQGQGATYSVNGGAPTALPGSVSNGQTIVVQAPASGAFSTTTSATLTIGGATGHSATFHVRTRRDPVTARVVPQTAAGDSHTLVLASDGTVFATGYNGNGQLGNGTTLGLSFLRPVSGVAGATDIAAGAFHSLALRGDETVAAWGSNSTGQLGHGSSNTFEANYVDVPGLAAIVGIAAGNYHSVAVTRDGMVYAWGLNAEGQVGDGTSAPMRSSPVPVSTLGVGVTMIAAGGRHTLALLADGTVRAWGANESGQLGDGSTAQRNIPVPVSGLGGVIAIAAGAAHSLALRNDGTVVAWGFNAFGQLGLGDTATRLMPVAISALGNSVGLIAAGANHSLAVKAGGALYAWGNNANSQLCNGNDASHCNNSSNTNPNQLSPVPFATPALVVAIAGGARHSAAITSERRLHAWGDNFFGQVGNRSGNYNPHSASLNVLRGDSVISEDGASSTGNVIPSINSGVSVLEIDGQATSFDFGPASSSRSIAGRYKNASSTFEITNIALSVTGTSFSLAFTDCPAALAPGAECGFLLGFDPRTATSFTGELAVASNLVGQPERRTLYGSGIAPATAAISFAKTGYDFPPQTVLNPTTPVAYALTNTGNATLSVSSVVSTLADFSATHSCASVEPGASCSIGITFNPRETGSRVSVLTVTSNATGTNTVTVSGTGVAATLPPLALVSVKSRKSHNGSPFDLAIVAGQAIDGAITVEPRVGSTQQIVFTFNNPITAPGSATAKDAANNNVGSVAVAANGSEVVVTVTNVPEAQRLTVSLAGVNNTGVNATAAIGLLAGDVDGTRSVTASDILRTKGRLGQALGVGTFVYDSDVSGILSQPDVDAVKLRAGISM
jgi:alpha-tubulin suppressor-like RCC1 family protein